MNIRTLTIVALAVMSMLLTKLSPTASAQSAVLLEAYGVWDRSNGGYDPADPDYDYLLALVSGSTWEDIQPVSSGHFDWSATQADLQLAYDRGQMLYLSINPGPDAPQWVYDNGVPKVTTLNGKDKWPWYPYYQDPNYITFFHDLIDEYGTFLRTQPQHLLERIAFVQVKTGCTGDEAPYKGSVIDPQYEISNAQWLDFRLNAFEKFRLAFLTGSEPNIPLLFNNIDSSSNPQEWNWIITNIGSGFGFKGSAYVRGHHLTGARTFTEKWKRYTVNPQGLELFSRAEMDQTWKNPLYQINESLGFYWGAISGLNTGLCVWDVTSSAVDQAVVNPPIQDTFRFFNKYAGQVYPATSTRAFIAMHEGLDSSDTVKFPEAAYGSASKTNQSRYTAICSDPVYAARGALMEDLYAATKGQVYQRSSQTGYNDAGWEIWPTNYSRFITQVDPDNESIGLFRIGGTITTGSPIYSRFARAFENSSGKNAMYFKLVDGFFNWPAGEVAVTVIYYDDISGSTWDFKYDAGVGNFKTAYTVTCTGSDTWKTKTVTIPDAVMLNNGPSGSDFALINGDGLDDIFHLVEIERTLGNMP
ncbi:MAG: T9SS C-terminal target domain-containing protein, partial [Planctomycetes bacterium]|nr:T9SS C-terminal target domain-containing protein [Planctomycetota bacterium]